MSRLPPGMGKRSSCCRCHRFQWRCTTASRLVPVATVTVGVSSRRLWHRNSTGQRRPASCPRRVDRADTTVPALLSSWVASKLGPKFPSESSAHFRPPAANLLPPSPADSHRHAAAAALRLQPRCELQARPSPIERPAPGRPGPPPAGPPWCRLHRMRPKPAGPQVHGA